jgi:tRNA G10  N-methylase Trm11
MKKYLFVLGRNIGLSGAEVESFLEKERIKFNILSNVKNGLLVETDKVLEKGTVEKLGGTISIGEVLAEGSFGKISQELDTKSIYFEKGNKLNYVVFNFGGDDYEEILDYLKMRFKGEKLKATEKKITGNIKLQTGEFVPNVISNLINEEYFVFGNCFGKIIDQIDYDAVEKRDMEKPVRRNELSISPRLAKILINLSQVRKEETLLDPFCGVGTILQEALLQNVKVIGVDRDKNAIHNAKVNLKWFKFKEENYKVIDGDSSLIKIPKINAVATEPDLGELHTKSPTPEKAKQIVSGFEKLMINVLNNLKKEVNGRIVFTAPLIETGRKKISPDFNKIAKAVGLKIVLGPIQEFREKSIVGRNILVFE